MVLFSLCHHGKFIFGPRQKIEYFTMAKIDYFWTMADLLFAPWQKLNFFYNVKFFWTIANLLFKPWQIRFSTQQGNFYLMHHHNFLFGIFLKHGKFCWTKHGKFCLYTMANYLYITWQNDFSMRLFTNFLFINHFCHYIIWNNGNL